MSEQELRDAYNAAASITRTGDGKDVSARLAFKKVLESHLRPEFDAVHYELLKNRSNLRLYQLVRAEFAKRPNAEGFLLSSLSTENDPETQADILQILGHMRSRHAAKLAHAFLEHALVRHREVALFVLGWVGEEQDIATLNKHLVRESETPLRITAAGALRQLTLRLPELKSKVLVCLKTSFEHETNGAVFPWIILVIETIARKDLGLRENKENPDQWLGDIKKARKRTAAFLASL